MKKAMAIKLNDQYAKLTNGSRYQMTTHVHGQETLIIFDQRASQVEAH